MNETIAEYTERIAGFVEGKDPLEVQRETPFLLEDLTAGASDELLRRERSPGKWSIGEILAHLAEVEMVSTWRYRQIIEHGDRVTIAAFDQNEWVRLGDYRTRDARESLTLFRLLRENNLRTLTRLSRQEWERFGVHAERGKMTVQDLVRQMAGHDLNHIEQIREIVGEAHRPGGDSNG